MSEIPKQVLKYFQMAIPESCPKFTSVRFTQKGVFRFSIDDIKGKSFTAKQKINLYPRGFEWDAKVKMAPFIYVHVHDSYKNGIGSINAKISPFFTVMKQIGNHEINMGSLYRYLAEAVWFPFSLLPENGVIWKEIDSRKALATLTDSGLTVSLEFTFNELGEIVEVFTPDRYYEYKGKFSKTPWRGTLNDYSLCNGMKVPLSGSVGWELPDGFLKYWEARISDFKFEL